VESVNLKNSNDFLCGVKHSLLQLKTDSQQNFTVCLYFIFADITFADITFADITFADITFADWNFTKIPSLCSVACETPRIACKVRTSTEVVISNP